MSVINRLSVKTVGEVGFAEDIRGKGFEALEKELKKHVSVVQFDGKFYVTEKIQLEKWVDNGILCNIDCAGRSFERFIPERLLKAVDLNHSENIDLFAKKVADYWKKIKNAIELVHDFMVSNTPLVFTEPNTLVFRLYWPKGQEKAIVPSEEDLATAKHYLEQEKPQWNELDPTNEKKLLFDSKCILKSSLQKEHLKLTQSNIEHCFLFFPVIDRAVYKYTVTLQPKDSSDPNERKTCDVIKEDFFVSWPLKKMVHPSRRLD